MSQFAVAKNISFFRDHRGVYAKNVREIDTYAAIRSAVAQAVYGARSLLDVGHGLIFHYDVTKVRHVVGLDLFINPPNDNHYPENIEFKKGSALSIPEPDCSFDTVLMEMLLHHLVDKTSSGSVKNVEQAISEGFRVLKPKGKLIIVESCVPPWFYALERAVFPTASRLVDRFLLHPMALQYPNTMLAEIIRRNDPQVTIQKIPKGRWLIQFGFKYPAFLTPVDPWMFVAHK